MSLALQRQSKLESSGIAIRYDGRLRAYRRVYTGTAGLPMGQMTYATNPLKRLCWVPLQM